MELRALTRDERRTLARLTHARTAPTRAVERARIIWQAHTGVGIARTAYQASRYCPPRDLADAPLRVPHRGTACERDATQRCVHAYHSTPRPR